MIPIIYDKQKNSVRQFFRTVGISVNFGGYTFKNPNPALDKKSIQIFRRVKEQNTTQKLLPFLMNVAHSIRQKYFVDTYRQGEFYLLSLEQRWTIYNHYKKVNENLRARYFPEMEVVFPPLEPSNTFDSKISVDEEIIKAIYEKAWLHARHLY